MVAATIANDGFEWKIRTDPWPGSWQTNSSDANGADSGITQFNRQLLVGITGSPNRQYRVGLRLGPLAISAGQRVSSFNITLRPVEFFKTTEFIVRGIADPSIGINYSKVPSDQVLTTAQTKINTANYPGHDPDGSWVTGSGGFSVKIAAVVNEILAHPNWTSGSYIWLDMLPIYLDTTGYLRWESLEFPGGTTANATYELEAGPTITSASGNDIIRIGEQDVQVVGTNLDTITSIKIFKGASDYPQTVVSASSTLVTFNLVGSIPLGEGYTLQVATSGGVTATRTVEIFEAADGTSTGVKGTGLTIRDGHEYGATFPGTWENVTSVASGTDSLPNQVLVGEFGSNNFKASIRVGPVNVDPGTFLSYFRLKPFITNCFRYCDIEVRAIADPDIVIGPSTIITGQTLTLKFKSHNTADWENSSATSSWSPLENPKTLDASNVAEEVISHANWASGKYITFILDFNVLGSDQGYVGISATESAFKSTKGDYRTGDFPAIISVNNFRDVAIGQTNVAVFGRSLDLVESLTVTKGAISETQTILSQDTSYIYFDLEGGTLVPDNNYTLEMVYDGDTFTGTFDIIATPGAGTVVIQSFSGNDIVRDEEFDTKIVGIDLDTVTSVSIVQGSVVESFPIKDQTATEITIDFFIGKLKCGDGTLTISDGVSNYTLAVKIFPQSGFDFVDITDATENDNSLFFNADPPFNVGDQIIYSIRSAEGYVLNAGGAGVITVDDGASTSDPITFEAASYDSTTNTWYDVEQITYLGGGFTSIDEIGAVGFNSRSIPIDSTTTAQDGNPNDGGNDGGSGGGDGSGTGGGSGGDGSGGSDGSDGGSGPVITPGGTLETWSQVDKSTTDEGWT